MTAPDGMSVAFPHADPAAPALLTIDLAALADNYRTLAGRAPGAECAAVVKADAYGIGADRAIPALAAAGCRTFFTATLDEGRRARASAPGATVYALDGLFPGTAPLHAEVKVRPVLGSVEEVQEWAAFCRSRSEALPAAIHIDTGINRLGLRPEAVEALAGQKNLLAAFAPALVMSHLACADQPCHPLNERQRLAFEHLRTKLPAMPASLANSPGIFLGPLFHYDMVRAGVALYGARAVTDAPNPMKPVVALHARIAQVRTAAAGEAVGYGASTTLAGETRIATVMAGYADGIFRRLGAESGESRLTAFIGDHPAPVLGRVSMDMMTLDVTHVPEGIARRGAFVELIGPHTSIDELADRAGTIGYEVLTGFGRRYQRIYTGDPAAN